MPPIPVIRGQFVPPTVIVMASCPAFRWNTVRDRGAADVPPPVGTFVPPAVMADVCGAFCRKKVGGEAAATAAPVVSMFVSRTDSWPAAA